MHYAHHLTMIDHGDHIEAQLRNPWDTTLTLQTLFLVHRDSIIPMIAKDGVIIRVPLQKSIVYTSVHNSLIYDLGASDAIAGVCDSKYISSDAITGFIESGKIADCGMSTSPDVERLIMLSPDALLLSAYENSSDHDKVAQLGIPIIDCIDYMEISPLAGAEWMRFFGRLYGKGETADSLFNATERAYLKLKELATTTESRPTIIHDIIYGATWSMPTKNSTTGILIEDAGGKNPFDSHTKMGSVQLSPEEVLYTSGNAEYWLIRHATDSKLTYSQLGSDNPLYTQFRAFENRKILSFNLNETTYFDDLAFHPDRILAEYISIIHPELIIQDSIKHYYSPLQP